MANYSQSGVGYDLTFELNEFEEPKLRSEIETLKDALLFVLFTKPGQYPSLPQIGMNIQNELYSNYDKLDTDDIKNRIIDQCHALGQYLDAGTIAIRKTKYKNIPSLLIYVEGTATFPPSYKSSSAIPSKYYIGLTYDDMKNMIYNINAV